MSTILLLEDDPLFRRLVLEVLERRGHVVLEAGSGSEADAVLAREAPELVIVDGNLPDTNGIAWIRAYRARGGQAGVIFVSATWRDTETFRILTKELGVGLVVHKPVIPAVFGVQVETQLETPPPKVGIEHANDPDGALAQLRADYARRLPEKVAALKASLAAARKGTSTDPSWETARGIAHKLKGTAGSYGFHEVAGVAASVEDLLGEARRGGPDVDAWAAIEQAIGAAEQAAERALGHVEHDSVRPFTLTSATALAVSDDPIFLDAIVESGRQHLVDVLIARTDDEALALARLNPPDMAFLELDLEGAGSSLALANELRALPSCESLPLAFVSGDVDLDHRVAAAHAGASLYLPKPIEPDALGAAIRQLLAAREAVRPHVLVIDDDEAFASRLAVLLRHRGMHVTTLSDPHRTLETLDELRPDILLMDVVMPGVSGFDLCQLLRATPTWQELPILLVSGKTELDARVAAFRAGADDYLVKPVVPEELLARVKVRIERSRLLRERASKDPLTGLLLRAAFAERFAAMCAHARRHERPVTLCLLDLDHFKRINDERGHLVGDRVLAGLGKLLLSRFRAEDVRARWGGEEFVLGFEGETAETIRHVLTRVLAEFRGMSFTDDDGHPFTASFSAGVATLPEDGDTLQTLLRVADRRLYAAKQAGRARVVALDGS